MTIADRIDRVHKRLENVDRLQVVLADAIEDTHAALRDVEMAVHGQQDLVPAAAPAVAQSARRATDLARLLDSLERGIVDGPVHEATKALRLIREHMDDAGLL